MKKVNWRQRLVDAQRSYDKAVETRRAARDWTIAKAYEAGELTQLEIAEITGLSYSYVRKIISVARRP